MPFDSAAATRPPLTKGTSNDISIDELGASPSHWNFYDNGNSTALSVFIGRPSKYEIDRGYRVMGYESKWVMSTSASSATRIIRVMNESRILSAPIWAFWVWVGFFCWLDLAKFQTGRLLMGLKNLSQSLERSSSSLILAACYTLVQLKDCLNCV